MSTLHPSLGIIVCTTDLALHFGSQSIKCNPLWLPQECSVEVKSDEVFYVATSCTRT